MVSFMMNIDSHREKVLAIKWCDINWYRGQLVLRTLLLNLELIIDTLLALLNKRKVKEK